MSGHRLIATYAVRADPSRIAERAQALALEQSVEVPLAAVRDRRVRDEVVARVVSIAGRADGRHDVRLSLALETTGHEPGQLLNMLFGNSSLADDVELCDVELPREAAAAFGGPRFGIAGWREAVGAAARPLTCSALKPLGLSPDALAAIAGALARAGVDVIKDDHGLADQASAPFAERAVAVQRAIDAANRATGGRTIYAPSLTGSLDAMRAQMSVAREAGAGALLIAPMVSGVSTLAAIAREARVPILAHPALAGIGRIAPPLLLGRMFRLFGADATIFPNAGGRFSYSGETCAAIARAARDPWCGLAPALPVPAGGMSIERVPEMLGAFGDDAMLLVGGSLLVAGDELESRCRAFVAAVRETAALT
ncbi:RuBisCO_large_IV RLP_RrRLP [Burkholderiales bacterium]|nr:RuBisCO_large_IV RLP_RrRLP [Burkholderiales bacterium]